MKWLRWLPILVLASCATSAPLTSGDDPVDDDGTFDLGKADGSSCLPGVASDESRGVLALANDPEVDAGALHAMGITSKTAQRIVAGRPYQDLAALDAVPQVGPVTCRALRTNACDVRGLCEAVLPLWTWNIEHFPLTPGAVDLVAETVQREQAELIGFEEVDHLDAFDRLMEKLPGWEGIAGETGFDTQVAIVYRTERLRVISTESLWTDDPYRFPRPPLAVTFEIRGRVASARFTLVTVHLKAMVDASSRERRRQAMIALEGWLSVKRAAGERVIVVGDYNDEIDAPTLNVFAPILGKPDAYAPLTLDVAQRHGTSYVPFNRLIDHILMTREAAEELAPLDVDPVLLDQSIPDYVHTVSDHRPVRAHLIPILPRS